MVAAGLVAAALLGSCSSVRNDLGTKSSPCYVSLPVAAGAVHHHGRFVGLRLVSTAGLRDAPLAAVARSGHEGARGRVCLIAYAGPFTYGAVEKPSGDSAGQLAVVVVAFPKRVLLGTVVVARPPLRFSHTHVGLP